MSVAGIAHVELACDDLAASRRFFTETLGLVESSSGADSVTLRCFGERRAASLILHRAERSGLVRIVWRLPRSADTNGKATGEEISPDGHRAASIQQVAPAPEPERTPRMRNQPSPLRGVGVEPRRLAHVGLLVEDPRASAAWWEQHFGLLPRELVEGKDGQARLTSIGASPLPADLLLIEGEEPGEGALHHVAFAVDHRDDLGRTIDLFAESDTPVEAGPGQHGVGQLGYVYAFEPSGNRIAVVTSPLLALDDWEPVTWPLAQAHRGLHWWGAPLPDSFFSRHT